VQAREKRLHVSISPEAEERIASFLREKDVGPEDVVTVIHPGSYEDYIRWSAKGFAEVADRLITDYGVKPIILAGPDEDKLVDRVCALMRQKHITASGLRLSETVSLIKRAALFIGNSTGPMHIAAALQVPVVAIFGNVHPLDSYQKWGPYGEKHIVVHKDVGCRNCRPSDCRRYRCMEAITPEDVMTAVKKLI